MQDEQQKQKMAVPEWYPQERVEAGYARLGHIKRVSVPRMEQMVSRDYRMYYANETQNLESDRGEKVYRQLLRSRRAGDKSNARNGMQQRLSMCD